MKVTDCLPMDEIFIHTNPDDGKVMSINASAMFRDAKRHLEEGNAEIIEADTDLTFVEFIKTDRGVEQWKLDRLEEPYLSIPAIGIWMDKAEGSLLTVDGHHRMVRWAERGDPTYKVLAFTMEAAQEYILDPKEYSVEYVAVDTSEKLCRLH